jgi:hypothetical protein
MLGKKNPVKAVPITGIKAEPEIRIVNQKEVKSAQEGPVQYEIKAPAAMQKYKEGVLEVKLTVADGWYTYVDNAANLKTGFSPTQIKVQLPEGFETVGDLVKPTSQIKAGLEVYKGSLVFQQRFRVIQSAGEKQGLISGKSYPINIQIGYQTCNDQLCLPPVEEQSTVTINYIIP